MSGKIIKPMIIYQMDPFGQEIGGVPTFVRSFIKHAPDDFDISFIGVTADSKQYPAGQWSREKLFDTPVNFFPILQIRDENVKSRIPLSLKFMLALRFYRRKIDWQDKILEFHRIEPGMSLTTVPAKKILFVHSNMKDYLYNPQTEMKWKRFPHLFFWLEDRLIGHMDKVFAVREDAVKSYRQRYPDMADRFTFTPTWVDEDIFNPPTQERKCSLKREFFEAHTLPADSKLILFVGRLEGAKDPLLLIDAFEHLAGCVPKARLIIVGTGSLENKMREQIAQKKLSDKVIFLGTQPPDRVAELMRISDTLALTSAFEGMPITVLEALGSGLPVVSTDVGEVKRVVKNGLSGILCRDRNPETIGEALAEALRDETLTTQNCVNSIQEYTARRILKTIYDFHYTLVKD
jgi:glycosyltransferase involved in cell wall biosynthesis